MSSRSGWCRCVPSGRRRAGRRDRGPLAGLVAVELVGPVAIEPVGAVAVEPVDLVGVEPVGVEPVGLVAVR